MEKNYKVFELGDYSIRFMPNINNHTNSIVELSFVSTILKDPHIQNVIFSYLLIDGKIGIYRINRKMKEFISGFLKGETITNSEGLILWSSVEHFGSPIENYFIDKTDGIHINVNLSGEKDSNINESDIKTDIIKNDPINLFDIKSPYTIDFRVRDVDLGGAVYKQYYNFRLVKKEHLFKDGYSHQSIIDLYNNVYGLEAILEDMKEEVQKYTDKNGNSLAPFLFNEEAKAFYWNKRKHNYETL